ncbi:MAG TPA: thiamine pyrophosphate-dependent enzyme [Thermoleophilaceae bacterium]
MKAAAGLIELLRSEGVDRVFGNPGTTELPFMEALALAPEMPYHLGLHEVAVVSMADGHARASRRTSFVNLHIAAGLANGLSMVLNARRARTPMVVTAGQQHRGHLIQDPMLGGDLLALSQGAFKEAVEVARVEDLGLLMRRAFARAQAPPSGPVLVSLPVDVLEEELPPPLPPRSEIAPPGPAQGLEAAAAILLEARAPAIVAGDGVGREGALDELVRVAEALGATVFHEPMYDACDFPATHPLSAGMMPPVNVEIRRRLEAHDVLFLVGSHAFSAHYYTPPAAIPDDVTVVQLDPDAAELGRNYAVAAGLHGGVRATLAALLPLLEGQSGEAGERLAAARAKGESLAGERDGAADDPAVAARALVDALPPDTVMIEEAITTGLLVRAAFAADRPGSYHHSVGGALGWGIGAGIGVKLARPDAPVVAVVGDGCAMYGIQGLWSAARYEVPVVVAVLNNREYRACKQGIPRVMEPSGADRFVGMDLAPPAIDFVSLAKSLGVSAARAEGPEAIAGEIESALQAGAPALVEIAIAGSPERRAQAGAVAVEA